MDKNQLEKLSLYFIIFFVNISCLILIIIIIVVLKCCSMLFENIYTELCVQNMTNTWFHHSIMASFLFMVISGVPMTWHYLQYVYLLPHFLYSKENKYVENAWVLVTNYLSAINNFLVKHRCLYYRTSTDNYVNSSMDENGDNIQANAYNVYKLLNNSNDQTSLNTFNETFHSGTNKLYTYNSAGIPHNDKYTYCGEQEQ